MAYHVDRANGVAVETDCIDKARTLKAAVLGCVSIVEGPVDFLRGRAVRKYGRAWDRDCFSDIG